MIKKLVPESIGLLLLLPSAKALHGQAATAQIRRPVYQAFGLPDVSGTLRYSLSASERASFGYLHNSSTSLSGNLAFLTASPTNPFSLIYSGGYLVNTGAQPSAAFQNMALSQVLQFRRWQLTVADRLTYLPQTPTTGLSGIGGLGDVGLDPGLDPDQSVLTVATRVTNETSASLSRAVTGKTMVFGSGAFTVQRFLGTDRGIQTNQASFGGGGNHRIDARTSVSLNYGYQRFTYLGQDAAFSAQGASLGYKRQWTRKLLAEAEFGPQRVSGSASTGAGPSYSYTANVHATFASGRDTASLSYVRSTNNGSGASFGAHSDQVNFTASRQLTRPLRTSAQVSYQHSASLPQFTTSPLISDSVTASVQADRAISPVLAVYLSYTVQQQSTAGLANSLTPINGVSQILGFGLTYSPRTKHLGHE